MARRRRARRNNSDKVKKYQQKNQNAAAEIKDLRVRLQHETERNALI